MSNIVETLINGTPTNILTTLTYTELRRKMKDQKAHIKYLTYILKQNVCETYKQGKIDKLNEAKEYLAQIEQALREKLR